MVLVRVKEVALMHSEVGAMNERKSGVNHIQQATLAHSDSLAVVATVTVTAPQVKEVALVHSEGMLAGEMKHGPLALVDENMPIVVIATRQARGREGVGGGGRARAAVCELLACAYAHHRGRCKRAGGWGPGGNPASRGVRCGVCCCCVGCAR